MPNEYAIHKVEGRGASLNDMRFRPTVRFELRFNNDTTVVAWRSRTFFADVGGRQINGLRLGAARALPKYQAYFDRTGVRWEVEQKALADAERAAKKKSQRIAYLEKEIPKLQEELKALKGG